MIKAIELINNTMYSDPDLVSLYRMEGNANDEKGVNNGTAVGMTYASGELGQEAVFSGGNSNYIDLGTPATLDFGNNGAFTFCGWITPSQMIDYQSFVCKDSNRTAPYSYMTVIHADGRMATYNGSAWADITPAGTIKIGIRQFIAYSYNGSTISCYVNGSLRGSAAFTYIDDTADYVTIGSWYATAYQYAGKMDDVSIWKRGLNVTEIMNLYKFEERQYLKDRGRSRTETGYTSDSFTPLDIADCKVWIDPSQAPIVADGMAIASMLDLSGNGNNLTQATEAKKPIYKIGVLNGLPVLRHTAASPTTWNIPWTYLAPCTFFYVAKLGTTKGRMLSGGTNNWLMGLWGGYENQYYCEGWVGANSDVAGTTNVYVWSAVVSPTSYLWKNGGLVKSGTGGVTAPAGLTFGSNGVSEFSDGDIGEIIGYNRRLSDEERQQIESYLRIKWGI